MLVKGEIKCLHCGHISGQWVGTRGAPLTAAGFRTADGQAAATSDPNATVRCGRCDGPVFLDDASSVMNSHRLRRIRRLRAQIAALDGGQRGRAA
jgi:hypothetical protein